MALPRIDFRPRLIDAVRGDDKLRLGHGLGAGLRLQQSHRHAACATFIHRISSLSRSESVSADDQPLLRGQEGSISASRLYGAIFLAPSNWSNRWNNNGQARHSWSM